MNSAKNTPQVLKQELEFLEEGGYRSPIAWRWPLAFEDSPSLKMCWSSTVAYDLFSRNREVFESSTFLSNVEGQRLHRRALAGVLHVVHFSGRGGERLTSLQVHSGLTLHLQGH